MASDILSGCMYETQPSARFTAKLAMLKRSHEESGSCNNYGNSYDSTLSTKFGLKRLRDSAVDTAISLLQRPDNSGVVSRSEMMTYFSLLEDPYIYDFLASDACLLCSDKYLLAMVFAYFKRAKLAEVEYTKMNFFAALFLANDMEEDDEDYKYEILPWALGRNWRQQVSTFLHQRDRLWARMAFRALVSSRCCHEVMALQPHHWAWQRVRAAHHVGAVRSYARDAELYELRGPWETPRGPCALCAADQPPPAADTSCSDASSSQLGADDDDDSDDSDVWSAVIAPDGSLIWTRARRTPES